MNHIQQVLCCLVDVDNYFYGISPDHSVILGIDKKNYKAHIEWIFPGIPLYKSSVYLAIARVNEFLVCIPWRTNNILIYNIETRESTKIKLNNVFDENKYILEFFYYCVCNDNIYILGTTIPLIICLDVRNKKVEYICDLYNRIISIKEAKSRYFFAGGCIKIKEWLYIPLNGYGAIGMINTKTRSTELRFLECDMDGFEGINKAGTEVCLLGRKEKSHYLVLWNPESNKTQIKKIPYEGESDLWSAFHPPVYYNSNIYLLPMSADDFYVMNMEEQVIRTNKRFDIFLKGCPKEKNQSKIVQVLLSKNVLTFITVFDKKWHKVNLDNGEYEDFFVEIVDENYWRQYERDVCCREMEITGYVLEGELGFNNFIDAITK